MGCLNFKLSTVQLIASLFGLLCLCGHHSNAELTDRSFSKVLNASYGSERLGLPWTAMSAAGCLARCMSRYSSRCQTFIYNLQTGLCTPGSYLKSGSFGAALAPTGTEGDLFAPSACDTRDSFSYVTSSGESACIMTSDFYTNFYTARNYCLNLGAHLFVGRTLEKYSLLPKDISWIIGITDLDVEGRFVWEDNGEEISSEFKSVFFRSGEPNNSNNNEDCVYAKFQSSTGLLRERVNDTPCHTINVGFVCERPML